ncbi:hypothetical protein Avbf_17772 [Armadillidium vulgare]|nr:hypothetical protein Avbf_17772 [Armadillidium vulgare]
MRFESLSCQRKCKLQLKFRKSWKFLYLIFNLVELISIASICQAELKINENFYEDKYKLYLIF